MMRIYSTVDENNVRTYALVREWTRSGLLEKEQGARLAEEVRPDLKRTNDFLRFVLFVFTVLTAAGSVLLTLLLLDAIDRQVEAAICGLAAVLCVVGVEMLAGKFRFYRFGIEEALAVMAIVFIMAASFQMRSPTSDSSIIAMFMAIAAAGGLLVYARLGLVYAGLIAIACAALLPFPLLDSAVMQRVLSAAIFGAIFLVVRSHHVFRASAWIGLYVVLNLQISEGHIDGWFYWATYVMTWILPILGLVMSIRARERLLMDASAATALATLVTNKSYLGLQHQTWDPILFGVFLMAVAIVIRRWLLSGPEGSRFGFTPVRILNKDERLLSVVSTVSAAFQPQPSASAPPTTQQPELDGGRSGGAGASGEF